MDDKQKKIPGILLVFVPKTAGVYIWDALSKGLGIKTCRISATVWPGDIIIAPEIIKFGKEGNAVSHEHLEAKWQNVFLLNKFLDKMLVNVRDPRMASLEWTYFVTQLLTKVNKPYQDFHEDEPGFESWTHDEPNLDPRYNPEGFMSVSLKEKIDVHLDSFFVDIINMVEGWLDCAEDPSFNTEILFTSYEDMVADENKYWDKILDFYGIERSQFNFKPFTPKTGENELVSGELHYRNARIDEWRDVFTKEQIERSTAMIPKRQIEKFGWPVK